MGKEETGKYSPGEIVFSKSNPNEKLVVRRYISRVYYCRYLDDPERKELVLYEREIVDK